MTASSQISPVAGTSGAVTRDPRLDVFRGLGMFIILIAHVPGNFWGLWIPARFGFSDAAEIFVFCSGMASAIAFGRVFDRMGWAIGTARVAFRVWQIYWAHIALFMAVAFTMSALNASGVFDKDYVSALNIQWFFLDTRPGHDTTSQLLGLMTLTYVPNYFDILPMYIVILAMMPFVVLLHRISPWVLLAVLGALWLSTQLGDAALDGIWWADRFGLPGFPAEPWSDRPWFFNPFGWQIVFYTGFALMRGWIPAPPVRRDLVVLASLVILVTLPIAWFRTRNAVPEFREILGRHRPAARQDRGGVVPVSAHPLARLPRLCRRGRRRAASDRDGHRPRRAGQAADRRRLHAGRTTVACHLPLGDVDEPDHGRDDRRAWGRHVHGQPDQRLRPRVGLARGVDMLMVQVATLEAPEARNMNRRSFLGSTAALALVRPASAQDAPAVTGPVLGEPVAFSPDTPLDMARALSLRPYAARASVPQDWLEMDYDDYRQFWFNVNKALWRDEGKGLEVDFFHPGLYFPRPVEIDVVRDGMARHVLFDLGLFDRTDMAPELSEDATVDFSGFRLRAPFQNDNLTEFAVFQGASYFRAIGRDNVYGLSARGLAIDTAEERGEEFPEFTHFWIEEPVGEATTYTVHAVLDSPSITGAFRFVFAPGEATVIDVTCTLLPRRNMSHVGVAPLTSMFLFDETNRNRFDDFRPQVHDSDVLLVHNGNDEMLARPLANPVGLQVSSFGDMNPKGFGLMQRARAFSDFADLEALYHRRPSLWIVPGEDWGPGAVVLVEIPADKEIYDNIVAYWRPEAGLSAGVDHTFSYRMYWGGEPETGMPVARVINTRMGARFTGGIIAAIDFENTEPMPDDVEDMTIVVTASAGEVRGGILQRNPDTGGPRLAFTFEPGEETLVELRAQLFVEGEPASEVWLYRWTR